MRRRGSSSSGPGLVAHIDGGARGNPGPAGYGVYVEEEGRRAGDRKPIAQLHGYLGIATNNTAEYAALLALLEYAVAARPKALRILSDSELLTRQMEGTYRVKDPKLRVLHAAARRLVAALPHVSLQHIPREENREADALANLAMDRQESSGSLPSALRSLPRGAIQAELP